MANQSENQGGCAQEALPKDSESTVSGMTPNTRDHSPCEPMLYIGLEFIFRDIEYSLLRRVRKTALFCCASCITTKAQHKQNQPTQNKNEPLLEHHQPSTTKAKIFQEMTSINDELRIAAWAGLLDNVSRLLEMGAAVNGKDIGGFTALHIASQEGHLETVCLLLEKGAVVDGKNNNGDTALHRATVTPSMRKSSGVAVFGTPGYICPLYAHGTMAYKAACDVYSIGIVLVELIVGHLQNGDKYGDYYCWYIKDIKDEPVVDGWKILMKDADGQVTWNDCSLECVCKIAMKCIMAGPSKQIKTDKLVQELSDVVNLDVVLSNDMAILTQQPSTTPSTPAQSTMRTTTRMS
jgi:hypothetical protein